MCPTGAGRPSRQEEIERHYGALLDGVHNVIAGRPDAFETELEMAAEG